VSSCLNSSLRNILSVIYQFKKTMASAPVVSEVPGSLPLSSISAPIQTKAEVISDQSLPRSCPWAKPIPPSTASTPWAGMVSPVAKSPVWGPKASPPGGGLLDGPKSFSDIMSEELAVQLADEEEKKLHQPNSVEEDEDLMLALELSKKETGITAVADDDTSNDLLMAQMLQLEFDKEHDAHLARQEQHVNQNSKVTLSYRNFNHLHPVERETEDQLYEEEEVMEEKQKEPNLKFTRTTPGKGKSKHDIETGNKRNADRIMNFPPEFETGDGDAIAMRLPNHVYNDLKVHSHKEQKISAKVRDKVDKSTAEMALDTRTRLILYKLVNSGAITEVHGTISTGKESVVIYAKGGGLKDRAVPSECAIKVFKTSLNEFKSRAEYMTGDHRLPAQGYKKQNPRKIIRLWAEKEMHNLNRLRRAGVHCPEVVALRKHVLIMSFIGNDRKAACKLKDAQLSSSQMEAAQAQTVEMLKTTYQTAGLVHADLSEYNILWHASHIWFIDVSQSVELIHPHALEFLYRDCVNMATFFKRQGLPTAISTEELFNSVTEMNIEGTGPEFRQRVIDLQQSEEFVRKIHGPAAKHQLLVDKEMAFDYFFEKAQKQRKKEQREKEKLREEEDSESESSDEE